MRTSAAFAMPPRPQHPLKTCAGVAAAMVITALLTVLATPRLQAVGIAPSLEATVPAAFADWKTLGQTLTQVKVAEGVQTEFEQPYDQTLMRTYVNGNGETVMLALAWGAQQRQDVKVHRPEVCYAAGGFSILRLADATSIGIAGRAEPVRTVSMLAANHGNIETVRYWIRIGDTYDGAGLAARWHILKEGFQGRVPDGILVRASKRIRSVSDEPIAQASLERFLIDLTAALPPATLSLLAR